MIVGTWPLVGADTMRRLDRHTIETLGVPGALLMESAGRAVCEAVLERLGPGRQVLVVCGPGNNGGDGLVVARHLQLLGVPVEVARVGEPPARGDASLNLARARSAGVVELGARWRIAPGTLIVDALLGTGLSRPVAGPMAQAIRRIQRAPDACEVIAVDLPSGLDGDTGQSLGLAIQADLTVTLGLPKLGLTLEPGRSLAGRIRVARIGICDEAPGARPDALLWTAAEAGRQLPERPRTGHKGSFGHALLVAGSEGHTGAAALAAEAAGRCGAGLVTLACPAGLNDVLEVKCTEAMTAPLPDTAGRCLAAGAEEPLLALAATRDAVGLGPGLGRNPEIEKLLHSVVKRLRAPLVLDADGLNAFEGCVDLLKARTAPTILTPHPGEAARLLVSTSSGVNLDRVGSARQLARKSHAVVLLKGAPTVVASPGGDLVVNPTGGPALATGGTGDVLLGIVTALLAQGVPTGEAAALGAYLHGFAADRVERRVGTAGMLAGDLIEELGPAAERLRVCAGLAREEPVGERGLSIPFPESD